MTGGRALMRVAVAATLVWITTEASAAEVRGRLLLRGYQPKAAAGPRPGFHWELDNGFKETLRDSVPARRELAVVLVGEGEAEAGEREVSLTGGSLMPSTLVVRVGTTIKIDNRDEIAHELYALGLDGFSGEAIAPRGRRAIHLKTAGDWPLRDRLVPHARGHLHVLPDLVSVAELKSDGTYTFADVPAGTYSLLVFHGHKQIAKRPVEVGNKALTLDPFAPGAE